MGTGRLGNRKSVANSQGTMIKPLRNTAAILTGITFFGVSASASIVYDNSTQYLGSFTDQNNFEAGDEIQIAGTDRTMTAFSFEYSVYHDKDSQGNAVPLSGNETAELFLRARDGDPNGLTPGTILYDSGAISLAGKQNAAGFGTITAENTSVQLPASGDLVWTVKFSGIENTPDPDHPGQFLGEHAGLLYYGPVTVGSSFDDYWINKGNGFELVGTDGLTDNFGAQLTAVPEPSTIALVLLGASAFGIARFRRKS